MSSPFKVRDLGQLIGSWPFIPDSSGSSVVQAPSSIDARATILGLVREPGSGYAVGGKNFNLWVDVGGVPTATQVTFTAGNKTLVEVITTINTALGLTVASDDNGFLRLTSPTIGADSYLRLESISGSEDVFAALGLFSETIAQGGDISQAQHIDPSRGVAGSKQYSVAVGEPLEAATVNRGLLQVGFNAGAAEGRTSIGTRTRKVRETVVASGEIGFQVGTSDPTRKIYVGNTTTPSNAELKGLIRVLDTEGKELVRDVFFPTGETVTGVDVQSNVSGSSREYVTVDLNGGTFAGGIQVGDFIQFLDPAGGLESEPRRVVQTVGFGFLMVETGGLGVGNINGINIEKYEGYGSVKVQVEGFYDSFSAPATFGSRVEGVSNPVPASTGTVTAVERGNRVVVSDPAVIFTNANVNDLVVWTSAGSSSPWSNNGTYRIKAIIDDNTLELVNEDYSPAILNPDTTGGLGDIAVTSEGAFAATPFIRLTPQTEGNAATGVGLVPGNGENIILEYYVEETYVDGLVNSPNAQGSVSSSIDADIQELVSRFGKMHDSFGYGTNIFADTVHIINKDDEPGPLTVVGTARWLIDVNFPKFEDRVRARVAQGEASFGEFAGYDIVDFWDQSADTVLQVSGGSTYDKAGVVIGYPTLSSITGTGQTYPANPSARLTLSGDGVRAASSYAGIPNINTIPASFGIGFRRDSEAVADSHTYWTLSAVGDGTDAILKLALLGLYEEIPNSVANAVDNQMVFHSSGAVGINLADVVSSGGKLGVPDANLHVRARSDTDYEALRIEGFSPTSTSVAIGLKTNTDADPRAFIGVNDQTDASWFLEIGAASGTSGILFTSAATAAGGGTERLRITSFANFSVPVNLPDFTGTSGESTGDGELRTNFSLDVADFLRRNIITITGEDTGDSVDVDLAMSRANIDGARLPVMDWAINARYGSTISENRWFRTDDSFNSVIARLEPASPTTGGEVFSILWKPRTQATDWTDSIDNSSGWTKAFSIKAQATYTVTLNPLNFVSDDWTRVLDTNAAPNLRVDWTKSAGSDGALYVPITGLPDGVTLEGASFGVFNIGTDTVEGTLVKQDGSGTTVIAGPVTEVGGIINVPGAAEVIDNESFSYYLYVYAASGDNVTTTTDVSVEYSW